MATDDSPRKIFNDPIHGPIALHPVCVAIVNTPQFQRLRNIKQLGGGYFVYPAASHNRFEHSLGVCHLAGELIRALKKNQPELDISDKDVLCVEIAGLCHDLGHGPFSHVFDSMVIPGMVREGAFTTQKDEHKTWKHENSSKEMFDYIMKSNPRFAIDLSNKDQEFIKNMICPDPDKMTEEIDGRGSEKMFFYEIVANKESEVDVDKWDYFARDCHHLGMRSSFDHKRYIHFARVLKYAEQMRLCMRDKEAFNIYQLFQTRHALHKKAYKHKVTSAVEYMIADALINAKDVELVPAESGDTNDGPPSKKRKIQDCIDQDGVDAYTNLTDDILQLILASDSKSKALRTSRRLIKALYKRQIYSYVGQTRPFTHDVPPILEKKSEEMEKLLADDSKLPQERIIVQEVKLDFGKKVDNPVDKQLFYSKGPIKPPPKTISQDQVSLLVPKQIFQERMIRVYLRQDWTKEWTTDWTEEKHKEECKKLKESVKKLLDDYFLKEDDENTQEESEVRTDDQPPGSESEPESEVRTDDQPPGSGPEPGTSAQGHDL